MRPFCLLLFLAASACAPVAQRAGTPAGAEPSALSSEAAQARLSDLADRLLRLEVERSPASAYWLGIPIDDHSRWPDRSLEARSGFEESHRRLLAEVEAIEAASLPAGTARAMHAAMLEKLRADEGARICRFELWNVNHMSGWHLGIADVAREQPVGTAAEREQALVRWSALPLLVDQEITNISLGLDQGYSAPKPVVRKVVRQIEGLLARLDGETPFLSPAARSGDADFQTRFREVVRAPVAGALTRYRDFLEREYLPRARDSLGVSAHPDGAECYRASLRRYTTLDRDPRETFRLGQETVAANVAFVRRAGEARFGTSSLPEIVAAIAAAPDNRFGSEAELINFSREMVARSREKSRELFLSLPDQEMLVEPFPEFRRGSGGSSYYENQPDPSRPAYYRINSEVWPTETRGAAEITAVHEGYPGHHMQIALVNEIEVGPVAALTSNSAYVEGWARYAEVLAEEAEMYRTPYAPMTRRLWPARGMVADPGLHLFGWSREQVIDYLVEPGRFSLSEVDDLVDRMAVWPGQLAAYDTGALEIMALRREAERGLGERFELREFHQRVLENGAIPLTALRKHIEWWIGGEAGSPASFFTDSTGDGMKRLLPLAGLIFLLVGCAHHAGAAAGVGSGLYEEARPILRLAPAVDHHQHLLSPDLAAVFNGPAPLPAVELPREIANLLRQREERWNDSAMLAELFSPDALAVLNDGPASGFIRGGEAIATYLSGRFSRSYQLTPIQFARSGSLATVSGYYTRGSRHISYFQLTLQWDDRKGWRIASEVPSFRTEPFQDPITAADLIAMLDEAGIERAIVLSGAFGFGSRNVDFDRLHRGSEATRRLAQAENDWVADQAGQFPDRLIAFCSFGALEPFAIQELDRCAASRRFRGVKLHLDESAVDLSNEEHVGRVQAIFARANAHRLPIVVHVGNNQAGGGSDPANRRNVEIFLGRIAIAAPDVPIQIAHLWGGQGFSEAALAAYADAVAGGGPGTANLWFDIAEVTLIARQYGDRRESMMREVASRIRQIGVERILFGSDGALIGHLRPAEAWQQFLSDVPLTEEEFRIIARNEAPYVR